MSNNNDLDNDIDLADFDDEGGGFDDFSKKGSLGDLWRNNPMVKIGVILAAFAVVVGGLILFGGGSKEVVPPSAVAGKSDVNETPGSNEISETMRQSIEDKNMENLEDATRTGGSAIPLPTEPSKGVLPIPQEEVSAEDPLERWRRMQEERVRQQEAITQAQTPQGQRPGQPPVDTKTPAVNALSQSMIGQMQGILQNQKVKGAKHSDITDVGFIEEREKKRMEQVAVQTAQVAAAQNNIDEQVENIIVPAGTIEYGQLLVEANTDAPGPILAQIVSGPLKGGRVLGSFQSTEQYLVLSFNQVVIDGINYPVQAVAIDPSTTLPGLITEIDNRYFKRIILPMAAEFVSGLAEAVSDSGTTSIYISDSTVTQSTSDKTSKQEAASGVSAAGDKLADILDEEADKTVPMLRVAAGTPIGVMFVSPVTDRSLASR